MIRPLAPSTRQPSTRQGTGRAPALRLRSRRLGVLNGQGRRAGHPRPVGRVFRACSPWPRRAGVRTSGHPPTPLTVRVGIALTRRVETRLQAVRAAAPVATARDWPVVSPASQVVASASARLTLLVDRAARQSTRRAATPSAVAAPAIRSAGPQTPQAMPSTFPGSSPRPVRMVHHAPAQVPAATTLPAQSGVDAPASGLAARWDDAPTHPWSVPLTSRDVPRVVDRVVREIEDRLSAERERRGWVG